MLKIDLTRNAIYGSVGNMNSHSLSMTYASVVSSDNVHLAFIITDLNDLDILAWDTQNTYSNALTK